MGPRVIPYLRHEWFSRKDLEWRRRARDLIDVIPADRRTRLTLYKPLPDVLDMLTEFAEQETPRKRFPKTLRDSVDSLREGLYPKELRDQLGILRNLLEINGE
jgi:hypothetical protein